MTDPNPAPAASAAVSALVERCAAQLEDSAASHKRQREDLATLAKKTKQPESRQVLDAAIEHHGALAGEATALAGQVRSAGAPMLADLQALIAVTGPPA